MCHNGALISSAMLCLSMTSYEPGPHAAMLYTCDGVLQRCCDGSKSHAMCCDKKFNMLNILLPILEYLSYLLSDRQTDFSIVMRI